MAPKLSVTLTTVVLKGGSVTGLVVLMALLLLGCACTSFLVCVHNTPPSMILTCYLVCVD